MYSNPYQSLEAIWTVLRLHASREYPLSVGEICHYLQNREQPPSRATVNRILTQVSNLLELFSSDPWFIRTPPPAPASIRRRMPSMSFWKFPMERCFTRM